MKIRDLLIQAFSGTYGAAPVAHLDELWRSEYRVESGVHPEIQACEDLLLEYARNEACEAEDMALRQMILQTMRKSLNFFPGAVRKRFVQLISRYLAAERGR